MPGTEAAESGPAVRAWLPWYRKYSFFGQKPRTKFSRKLQLIAHAMEFLPQEREELIGFLQVRIALADRARERAVWMLGRGYNWLSGENPDYVLLNGQQLLKVLGSIGVDAGQEIEVLGSYELRTDLVKDAYAALSANSAAGSV